MISCLNAVQAKWKLALYFSPLISLSLSLSSSPSLHLHNSHFAVKMRAKITCSFLSSLNLNFLVALESSDKKLQLIFASGNKYRIEPELVLFWFQFLQFCWQRETSERILNQSLHLHKYWVLESNKEIRFISSQFYSLVLSYD